MRGNESQFAEAATDNLVCPVTLSTFLYPVSINCPSLHTLEKEAAMQLLAQSTPASCPCCRKTFNSWTLNLTVKSIVDLLVTAFPDKQSDRFVAGTLIPSEAKSVSLSSAILSSPVQSHTLSNNPPDPVPLPRLSSSSLSTELPQSGLRPSMPTSSISVRQRIASINSNLLPPNLPPPRPEFKPAPLPPIRRNIILPIMGSPSVSGAISPVAPTLSVSSSLPPLPEHKRSATLPLMPLSASPVSLMSDQRVMSPVERKTDTTPPLSSSSSSSSSSSVPSPVRPLNSVGFTTLMTMPRLVIITGIPEILSSGAGLHPVRKSRVLCVSDQDSTLEMNKFILTTTSKTVPASLNPTLIVNTKTHHINGSQFEIYSLVGLPIEHKSTLSSIKPSIIIMFGDELEIWKTFSTQNSAGRSKCYVPEMNDFSIFRLTPKRKPNELPWIVSLTYGHEYGRLLFTESSQLAPSLKQETSEKSASCIIA